MIRKPGLRLYFLLFLLSFPAVSQQQASSGKELHRAELLHLKDERQKSRVLNNLAEQLLNNAPDSAFKYTMQARKLASKLDLKDELARSFLISGNVFYNHGIFSRAIEDFIKALQHYQITGNKKGQAEIHQDLGLAYHYSKKPDVALSHYQKSLSLFQGLKDENGVAGTLSYMGHIFEKNLEYQKALEYQQRAIKTYGKLNNQAGIAKVMDDIGSIYEDWEDYSKAFQYFSKALEINLKIDNRIAAIVDLNNIGDIYQKQGKYTEGLSYTFRSLELARQLHQKYQLRSAYRDISQTYFFLKDYQKAYAYLDSSYTVYGEVYNVETASQIARMQVIYETQEKDKEIALLETNKRFNRLLIYIFIGVIVIICCFSLVIFNRQRLLILKNKKILEQNQRIYTAELENKQLKEQKLSDELEMRSRELTGRTLLIIQKNEILVELLDKIQQTLRKKDTEKDAELKKLIRLIEHSTQLEKDWNEFKLAFEQVHGEFFARLQEKYPDLTSGELRLCALLKLNMDTKDLITTLGISQDSLRVSRHRLRKKLNLSQGDSLTHFIMSI